MLNAHKGALLTGLVPIFDPRERTNRGGILPVDLTLFRGIVFGILFETDEPLVVPVPAMQSLVLGRKPLITGSRPDVLDLVQQVLLLFVEFGDLVAEDLLCSVIVVLSIFVCVSNELQ